MNRIVLIGNGYDLSCGLKSTYENFLVDHIKNGIKEALLSKIATYYSDIVTIEVTRTVGEHEIFQKALDSITTIESIMNPYESKVGFSSFDQVLDSSYTYDQGDESDIYFRVQITSVLLSKLFLNGTWTDIENAFYQEVLNTFNKRNQYPDEPAHFNIRFLNGEFNTIKKLMIDYLKKIDQPTKINKRIERIFNRIQTKLDQVEFDDYFHGQSNNEISELLLVNFNYTNQVNNHSGKLIKIPFELLPIHGNLDNEDSIVFGYGDNSRKDYKKLREINTQHYFEHDKTYKYPTNQYLKRLNRFLRSDLYDVFLIGHSLGTSDKVLLKKVLDNKNCKAIRIFNRGNKSKFSLKIISLNSHYSNIENLMDIIVPFDKLDNINGY